MNLDIKKNFLEKWEEHFPGSELPIVCYYTDELYGEEFPKAPRPNKSGYTCIFSQLAPVRRGHARAFNAQNLGCFGARPTLGFEKSEVSDEIMDFLINVERYKKTPEHVYTLFDTNRTIQAQGKYIVFKRWDLLSDSDDPQVVSFFCGADAIAGLHALFFSSWGAEVLSVGIGGRSTAQVIFNKARRAIQLNPILYASVGDRDFLRNEIRVPELESRWQIRAWMCT